MAGSEGLESELDFLLRSIEDLESELDAGDVSPEDYEALRDAHTARAAEVLRALESRVPGQREPGATGEPGASPEPVGHRGLRASRRRRLLVVGALAAFAAAAIVLVAAKLTERLPGQFATGSVSLSPGQLVQRRLAQAAVLEAKGQYLQALQVYEQVLASDSRQPVALAEAGWLEYQAGIQSKDRAVEERGASFVAESVALDPSAYAGHLYLGTIDLDRGQPSAAVEQYRLFLAERPPSSVLARAHPFLVKAFSEAHDALPPGA
jgi:tetratricopeptide (TPR) repeat protein